MAYVEGLCSNRGKKKRKRKKEAVARGKKGGGTGHPYKEVNIQS